MFFRGHSVSKILAFDHVIEDGQIVGHLIKKITKYDKKPNKTLGISTALIIFWVNSRKKVFGKAESSWSFEIDGKNYEVNEIARKIANLLRIQKRDQF